MKINYRIKIEHNYHNKGLCRMSIYNLVTGKPERVRYIEDIKEVIEKDIETCKKHVSVWEGQVVQILES